MKKVFLFDCDGPLLDLWTPMKGVYEEFISRSITAEEWLEVIRDFNLHKAKYADFGKYYDSTSCFSSLQPTSGMVDLLHELFNLSFDLFVVTQVKPDEKLIKGRKDNLHRYYGHIFKAIHCIGNGDKGEIIKECVKGYDLSYFCDDSPKNVQSSIGIVTCPIWFENEGSDVLLPLLDISKVKVVNCADDIRKLI